MSRAVCIVNPHSGGGRTGTRWPAIAAALEAAGLACEARFTEAPGAGTAIARQALAEGAELVVAVGGDGSVHDVANGFFDEHGAPLRPDARLGVIPAGSGSDLIKTLGLPADPLAAAGRLADGSARVHDMARVSYRGPDGSKRSRLSINVASLGMAAHVLAKMAELPPWLHGQARYVAGSLLGFADLRPFDLAWRVDDEARAATRAVLIAVGTARYFGAGMQVLPQAVPDDGLLDVLVVEDRPVWELLPNFPRIYTGTHIGLAMMKTARGRRIELDTGAEVEIDGEIAGRGPALIEVLPAAIRICS